MLFITRLDTIGFLTGHDLAICLLYKIMWRDYLVLYYRVETLYEYPCTPLKGLSVHHQKTVEQSNLRLSPFFSDAAAILNTLSVMF